MEIARNDGMNRLFVRRSQSAETTSIELISSLGSIGIRIKSRLNSRQRRAIGIEFYKQIKPFLKYFHRFSVHHEFGGQDFRRDEKRGIPEFQSLSLETPQGQLGFEIRMRRLEFGWSQRELASRAGLSLFHLSKI